MDYLVINNNKEKTMPKPKCKTCNKTLKRVTQHLVNQKEPYNGNLICYDKKQEVVDGWYNNTIKQGDTIYSYRLWDGESYQFFHGKKFCGRHCAAMYAVRRLS
tara:strand:+ start:920 stop:1228 length:309 start_codon:yes stop_codon:yes gene_type:complete